MNGEANADYNADMRFEPMLRILEKADSENQVKMWSSILENETYELVYYGRRSFGVMDGCVIFPVMQTEMVLIKEVKILHNFSMAEKLWDLRFLFTCQL